MGLVLGGRIGPVYGYHRIGSGGGLISGAIMALVSMYVWLAVLAFWMVKAMLIVLYVAARWTVEIGVPALIALAASTGGRHRAPMGG